jgi:hypothetical protein
MGAVFGVTMMGIKLRSFDDIIADATLMSVLVTISWGIGTLKTAGEFTKSTFFHKYQRTKSGVPGSAG